MDRIKMNHKMDKTFEEGFEEYVLDMKARNLRQGTISHYKDAIRQIYKRIPPTTMISTLSKRTMKEFYEWRFRRVGVANYTKQSKKRNGERKGKRRRDRKASPYQRPNPKHFLQTLSLLQKQTTQHQRTCESLRNEQNYNLQVS